MLMKCVKNKKEHEHEHEREHEHGNEMKRSTRGLRAPTARSSTRPLSPQWSECRRRSRRLRCDSHAGNGTRNERQRIDR